MCVLDNISAREILATNRIEVGADERRSTPEIVCDLGLCVEVQEVPADESPIVYNSRQENE